MNDVPTIAQVAAACMATMAGDPSQKADLRAKISWSEAKAWHAAGVECGEIKAAGKTDDPIIAYCEVCCSHQPQLLHHDEEQGCRMECARCAAAKATADE